MSHHAGFGVASADTVGESGKNFCNDIGSETVFADGTGVFMCIRGIGAVCYITERWSGGMLTNFPTIRKAVKKMSSIDKMEQDGTFASLSKREVLQINRQREKLQKNLGSIVSLTRLPAALFVVDVVREHIAIKEATRLGIPVFAIVDTNADPNVVDFAIPGNDDAAKSVEIILSKVCEAIQEGLEERKADKDKEAEAAAKENKAEKAEEATEEKPVAKRARKTTKK